MTAQTRRIAWSLVPPRNTDERWSGLVAGGQRGVPRRARREEGAGVFIMGFAIAGGGEWCVRGGCIGFYVTCGPQRGLLCIRNELWLGGNERNAAMARQLTVRSGAPPRRTRPRVRARPAARASAHACSRRPEELRTVAGNSPICGVTADPVQGSRWPGGTRALRRAPAPRSHGGSRGRCRDAPSSASSRGAGCTSHGSPSAGRCDR